MEAAPPSYEKATLTDVWDIAARYIPSGDLCSAALVSSRWHATFAPHLWGNPASHFGIENDRVYVALTRFKRTLETARLFVRSLTHTLHLPPARAELYNGPHSDWLRDILARLPNLQSLIVQALPFFDHAALQALRSEKKPGVSHRPTRDPFARAVELPGSIVRAAYSPSNDVPTFGLRLLDASRCPNVTSDGLAQALKRFDALMYLDLSYTSPAKDARVTAAFDRFYNLQVLKLRGLHLKDRDVESIAASIGRRVRSLDLRNNSITDRGVRILLNSCFSVAGDGSSRFPGWVMPSLLPYLGADMLETYQGEDFESFLRNAFTSSFVSRLAIEDAPEHGTTHLYISNNDLTVEGVSALVRSARLHVLDVGTIRTDLLRHPTLAGNEGGGEAWSTPGAEKLTPLFHAHACEDLTFLRIDHSLVTRSSPANLPYEVISGRSELADTTVPGAVQHPAEIDGTQLQHQTVELPAGPASPRYELVGDPMQVIVSPAINDPPHDHRESEAAPGPRRGSAFAPEVVESATQPSATPAPTSSPEQAARELARAPTLSPNDLPIPSRSPRPRTYSSLATERHRRLQSHTTQNHTLHPAMLPHLRTLILTNVPAFSPTSQVAESLISFITHCAQEYSLAKTQAKLDYSLPPGRRDQASALRHSADKIFALKRVVLELAPDSPARGSDARTTPSASRWQHAPPTRSMTEDRDSEALWAAAATDFSFFGDADDCAFPSIDSGRAAGALASTPAEKEVSSGPGRARLPSATAWQPPPRVDNMALLSAFRTGRRLAHQRDLAGGGSDVETDGFWPGVIRVVKPSMGATADEGVDYYGDRFTNDFLYR